MFINSLKTKLIIFYLFLIIFVIFIKVGDLNLIQLPQLYALEALSDEKDISRIKMAFTSKSREYGVINYDNAVWDDTYHYVDNKNSQFTESNFVLDTYKSLGINGIHIYDKQTVTIWQQAWNITDWSPLTFPPFDQPSTFVKKHILISEELIIKNNNKPVSRVGFTLLDDKLILFAATSIFKANLTGNANGTMLFWRFFDEQVLTDLQQRAGIKFTIEVIQPNLKNTVKLTSKNSFIKNSYRTKKDEIFDIIPLITNNGAIKFTYQAPIRQFATSWLNHATIVSSTLLLLTLGVLFIFFHYFIIRPILQADNMVTAIIKDNDHSIRFASKRKDELGTLFNLIDRLLDGVESNEQQLISHNVRLQHISQTDSLTKIPNRRAFDTTMKKLLQVSPLGLDVAILVVDVDYFKKYNDCYGHAQGDKTLYAIAQTLRKNLHEDTDFVARYGGEEFVVVLKNTDKKSAQAVANNLVNIIADLKISHQDSDITDIVTISIGIHAFVISGQTQYMPLFELADQALYQAKEQGRNRAITTD
ncbi:MULTISPECIES: sensor domain-containing diguanylate cyclase [Colwellia]|uniref:diguanylate cyclase n=1 Tax=Colwellia marinimaniae TaxID=1513592 RepID=A0ABQ0MQX3_9GAMM|nr:MULTISPECIES: diguanylate cyclase [Colwellia]GAW94734.1 diguanylate cyclase [Colwellia marinimaniae]